MTQLFLSSDKTERRPHISGRTQRDAHTLWGFMWDSESTKRTPTHAAATCARLCMTNATPGKSCRGALSPRNSATRLISFFLKKKILHGEPVFLFITNWGGVGGWGESNPSLAAENMRLIGFITARLRSLSLHTLVDASALNHQHSAPVPPLAAALILFKNVPHAVSSHLYRRIIFCGINFNSPLIDECQVSYQPWDFSRWQNAAF